MIEFKIEADGQQYHTWCPQLPGCHTHGKTKKEAMMYLKEAISLYLEDIMEESLNSTSFKAFA